MFDPIAMEPGMIEQRELWRKGMWQIYGENGEVKKRTVYQIHHEVIVPLIERAATLENKVIELEARYRAQRDAAETMQKQLDGRV